MQHPQTLLNRLWLGRSNTPASEGRLRPWLAACSLLMLVAIPMQFVLLAASMTGDFVMEAGLERVAGRSDNALRAYPGDELLFCAAFADSFRLSPPFSEIRREYGLGLL